MTPITPCPRNHVDCWYVSAAELPRQEEQWITSVLSPAEGARAARFRFEHDRRRYIAAHAALRLLTARYLGKSPESLAIRADANGRPILESSELYFNLSHSGSWAVIAFSSAIPLGVDVEEIRKIPDLMAIARSHFAATEVEAISRLSPDQRTAAFFVIWTRKEAFVKAIGRGISFPLQTFGTGHPHRPPYLTGQQEKVWADWTLADLQPDNQHLGAVAIRRSNMAIRCRRAEWSWLLRQFAQWAVDRSCLATLRKRPNL